MNHGRFFKRLMNFELYNPPMIDKKGFGRINSLYMNTQMKLIEREYGIKMSYDDNSREKNLLKIKTQKSKIAMKLLTLTKIVKKLIIELTTKVIMRNL